MAVPSCIQDGRHDKKIEISSNGQKLLYFKPESAQI
jgi:hypothetical protein